MLYQTFIKHEVSAILTTDFLILRVVIKEILFDRAKYP